jgi:hypothetical protein
VTLDQAKLDAQRTTNREGTTTVYVWDDDG